MELKLYYLFRGINNVYLYTNLIEEQIDQFYDSIKSINPKVNYYLLINSSRQEQILNHKFEKNINIEFIDIDLSFTIEILNLKNIYFFRFFSFKNHIDLNLIKNLYSQLNHPSKKYNDSHNINSIEYYLKLFNELVDFIKLDKELISNDLKNFCLYKNIKVSKLNNINTNLMYKSNHRETINLYEIYIKKIILFINEYEKINYLDYLSYNIITKHKIFKTLNIPIITHNSFENVYYSKKGFYDINGSRIKNSILMEDFEYKQFIDNDKFFVGNKLINNNLSEKIDIKNKNIIKFQDENILYLDYIYGFYNFGEFWDVIHRITSLDKSKKINLFHIGRNRVSNIKHFFNKNNITFPTTNQKLICNLNNIYFFKKINFLIIKNICRGYLDNFLSFKFNSLYNKSKILDTNYSLYLKRGSFGREIKNENLLIEKLKNICKNLIVIDGSEPFEKMLNYWTNAIFIIGAHGSLFKNMIYCRKNPIFIELTPDRHPCFYGNAKLIGLLYFYINLSKDNKENIILDPSNLNKLIELIKCIIPN